MAWYDAQNMGSAFPLLDYGTQTIARNVNNALPNNRNTNRYSGLEYGQQYFPDEEVVDETVTDINRPLPDYYTQQFGKQAFPHTGFNMPAAATNQYITRKEEPGMLRNIWEGTKDLASKAKGMPLGLLNLSPSHSKPPLTVPNIEGKLKPLLSMFPRFCCIRIKSSFIILS